MRSTARTTPSRVKRSVVVTLAPAAAPCCHDGRAVRSAWAIQSCIASSMGRDSPSSRCQLQVSGLRRISKRRLLRLGVSIAEAGAAVFAFRARRDLWLRCIIMGLATLSVTAGAAALFSATTM